MKLNKKLAILGVGLTASTGALAQTFYQCLPCPAGTYSKDGQCKQCERDYYCPSGSKPIACPSGTYSYPGSSVCCPNGYYGGNTKCFKMNDLTQSNFTQIASGGAGSSSCPTGTLQSGWYLVKLRGGKGGNSYGKNGAEGGTLQYTFFLPSTSSYQLCAGGNGGNDRAGGGGGGGSWLKLNFGGKDYYFVAGGGGGATFDSWGQTSGGGGGIGGGGGGRVSAGGRSGPYAGGGEQEGGKGLNNGANGKLNFGGAGGGGGGAGGLGGEYGGTCSAITINIINGYKTTITRTGNFGGGYKATSQYVSATSSHKSNVPNIGACGSSCAILYKLNL